MSRIAVITGAGSGIGRAVSLALNSAGYSVVLAGRRAAELEGTAAMAERRHASMIVVPTDITQPDAVAALFARTREAFGRLDVLFNNAGASTPGIPMEELTYEQWSAVEMCIRDRNNLWIRRSGIDIEVGDLVVLRHGGLVQVIPQTDIEREMPADLPVVLNEEIGKRRSEIQVRPIGQAG